MVLDWFRGQRDVDELIAHRKYGRAVDLLRQEVDAGNRDPRVRLRLADVLALENRGAEAIPVLLDLADEYASDGQAAKAIALLKKVQRLDPGRRDVEPRLARLIKDKSARRPAGYAPREGADKAGYEPAGAVFSTDHFEVPKVVTDDERVAAARGATWVPSTREEGPAEADIPALPDLPAVPPPSAAAPAGAAEIVDSPLFGGFSQEELVEVIRGLQLLTYEPGDIILTEGDPGDSLFVLTTGIAKTFIRRPEGVGQGFVRRLEEGDFFGEISILSGKPRTATVTAATHCELLELDRATLDGITKTYPHVRQVLEDFYIARASSQDEAMRRNT